MEHLDKKFELAKTLQEAGHLDEAEEEYRQLATLDPNDYRAFNNLGTVLEDLGRHEEALEAYHRALELNSESPRIHYNLGHCLHSTGRLDEAIAEYRQSLELDDDGLAAQYNLGTALYEQGKLSEAEVWLRRAVEQAPDWPLGHTKLANILYDQSRVAEALASYERAAQINPTNPRGQYNVAYTLYTLGQLELAAETYRKALTLNSESGSICEGLARCLLDMGRKDEAIQVLHEWSQRQPGNPSATHALASYTGERVPTRASADYIRNLFDEFADDFDRTLDRLNYIAPELVAGALAAKRPASQLDIVEIGCGTGLCGPLLRPFAKQLVGVDLSSAMLKKAAARNVYDNLVEADLVDFLAQHAESFDVVASADTLVYFGDLLPPLEAAATATRPEGHLIFTVESLIDESDSESAFKLNPHGRYSHSLPYLRDSLEQTGWSPLTIDEVKLRSEHGQPVDGYVVSAKRKRHLIVLPNS